MKEQHMGEVAQNMNEKESKQCTFLGQFTARREPSVKITRNRDYFDQYLSANLRSTCKVMKYISHFALGNSLNHGSNIIKAIT